MIYQLWLALLRLLALTYLCLCMSVTGANFKEKEAQAKEYLAKAVIAEKTRQPAPALDKRMSSFLSERRAVR